MVDRMVGIAGDRHGVVAPDAEQHAAADRAVAARGAHPAVDGAARTHGPATGLVDVGVAIAAVVDTEHALGAGAHAPDEARRVAPRHRWLPAAPRQNAPGMFSGTTAV